MIFGPRGISCDFFFPFFFPSFSPADRKPNSRHYDSHASPHRIHTTVTMASEEPTNRLYVGNIPWSTTVEELRGIFSQCGGISLVDIPTGRQGRSRGYGIVEYSNVQEAQVAITQLDGTCEPTEVYPFSFDSTRDRVVIRGATRARADRDERRHRNYRRSFCTNSRTRLAQARVVPRDRARPEVHERSLTHLLFPNNRPRPR
jgi:RNA recognition motif-containing protein